MHSAARPSASTPPLSSTSWSDTTNAIPLTSSPIHGALPAWSPDGSQIAFMGTPRGKSARIYLIARDGGEPKPVVPDSLWPLAPQASEHWQGGPTWSPAGRYLAALTRDDEKLMLYDFRTQKWTLLDDGFIGDNPA